MGLKEMFSRREEDTSVGEDEDSWDGDGLASPFPDPAPTPPMPALTSAHVEAVRFQTSKPGYAFSQVETFVQQVASSLSGLELALYNKDVAIHEARQDIARLEDQVSDLQATIEVFRAKGDVLTKSDGSFVRESDLADGVHGVDPNEGYGLLQRIEELETSVDAAEAEAAALTSERDSLRAQLEAARSLHTEASADPALQIALDETVEERDSLLVEVKSLQSAVGELRTELESLENQVPASPIETSAQSDDSRVAAMEAVLREAEERRDAAVSACAKAEAERDTAHRLNEEIRNEMTLLTKHIEGVEFERDGLLKNREQFADAKDEFLVRIGSLEAERDSAVAERNSAAEEIAALKRNITELTTALEHASRSLDSSSDSERVEELESLLQVAQADLEEVTAAEAELRAYVETTLAEWQQSLQAVATNPGPEVDSEQDAEPAEHGSPVNGWQSSDALENDDEWGDAPAAVRPEFPGISTGPADTPADQAPIGPPVRAHAPLIDAPEVQQQRD